MPRGKSTQTSKGSKSSTESEKRAPEDAKGETKKLVFVKNRTKQKQVLQVEQEVFSFGPYEKIETKLDEAEAKIKFGYWISKHILQIVN